MDKEPEKVPFTRDKTIAEGDFNDQFPDINLIGGYDLELLAQLAADPEYRELKELVRECSDQPRIDRTVAFAKTESPVKRLKKWFREDAPVVPLAISSILFMCLPACAYLTAAVEYSTHDPQAAARYFLIVRVVMDLFPKN